MSKQTKQTTTIKIGEIPITIPKKEVKRVATKPKVAVAVPKRLPVVGLETNGHTTYTSETSFANIATKVNITNEKPEPPVVEAVKGPLLTDVPYNVVCNTAGATVNAMKKRCDHKPMANPDMETIMLGHNELMTKFEPFETIQMTRELFEEYLSSCKPGKAERLRVALASDKITYDGQSKHVFAKAEVLLKENTAQPRVVYQGTDLYNAVTGAIIMAITRNMKRALSRHNPKNTGNKVLFACGMTNEELGDMIRETDGLPVESDATNNDGTQSKAWRKPEAMFYAKLGAPKWFVQEFARNTSVRVWTRYGIAATVEGQRWSGEGTTTTGNSYVHMCLMLATLIRAGVEHSTNIHGGDDYLGFVEAKRLDVMADTIPETFVKVGMEAKVVKPDTREHATFYRKRYVCGKYKTRGIPQLGRTLAKINLRANRNSEINDRDYMAGKYLSAAYECRYAPGISSVLIDASNKMSDKPHLDERASKLAEMGDVSDIKERILGVEPLDRESFDGFLNDVYKLSYSDVIYAVQTIADGCVQHLGKWTKLLNGKVKTVSGAPTVYLDSDVFKQLALIDT